MQNSQDLEKSQQLRFLLAGYMGSGKTTQFLTLPGKKFMYVFDPNALQTLRGHNVDYMEFCPDITDLDLSVKTLKTNVGDRPTRKSEPKTYIQWEADFEQRLEDNFFDDYSWIGFDSFTNFLEIIMDRTQYLSNRLGKQPEQADWAAQMITCQNVWRVITSMKCGVFATAHLDLRQNETSKKVYNHLMITGRLRVRLPQLFNNVWVSHADIDAKGKPKFEVQTFPDKEFPTIRSQFKTNVYEDVTIQDFKGDLSRFGLGRLLKEAGYGPSNTATVTTRSK